MAEEYKTMCMHCNVEVLCSELENHLVAEICKDCDQEFLCQNAYVNHVIFRLIHDASVCKLESCVDSPEYSLTCRTCHLTLPDNQSFVDHVTERAHHLAPFSARLELDADGTKFLKNKLKELENTDLSSTLSICHVCLSVFSSFEELRKHVQQIHLHPKYKLLCTACSFEAFSEKSLQLHWSTTHRSTCTVCDQKCSSALAYIGHVASEHPGIQYHCLYCGKKFTVISELVTHVESCTYSQITTPDTDLNSTVKLQRPSLEAKLVNKPNEIAKTSKIPRDLNVSESTKPDTKKDTKDITNSDATIPEDTANITVIKPESKADENEPTPEKVKSRKRKTKPLKKTREYTCKICLSTYRAVKDLLAHKKECGDIANCRFCGRKFVGVQAKMLALRHENREHLNLSEHACSYCDTVTSTSRKLKQHMIREHPEEAERRMNAVRCTLCGKAFLYASMLRLHMVVHTSNDNAECPHCGQQFTSKALLHRHMNVTHSNTRSELQCPECKKYYSRAFGLKIHMDRMHGPLRKTCDHCSSVFSSFKEKTDHIVTQHPEKLHVCGECGKAYVTLPSLTLHMKLHAEPSFVCICGKKYYYKSSLKQCKCSKDLDSPELECKKSSEESGRKKSSEESGRKKSSEESGRKKSSEESGRK